MKVYPADKVFDKHRNSKCNNIPLYNRLHPKPEGLGESCIVRKHNNGIFSGELPKSHWPRIPLQYQFIPLYSELKPLHYCCQSS